MCLRFSVHQWLTLRVVIECVSVCSCVQCLCSIRVLYFKLDVDETGDAGCGLWLAYSRQQHVCNMHVHLF